MGDKGRRECRRDGSGFAPWLQVILMLRTDKWTTKTKLKYKLGRGNGLFNRGYLETKSLYGEKNPFLAPHIKVNSRVGKRVHPFSKKT